jgi:hypothetical protein
VCTFIRGADRRRICTGGDSSLSESKSRRKGKGHRCPADSNFSILNRLA